MAVSNIQGISSARSRAIYIELGRGERYAENVRDGSTREAFGMSKGDLGSLDDFVNHCEAVAAAHPKRKYQAYSLIVSFSDDELDKDSETDVQRALDHGYELAKRLFPNSYCYVVAHNASGGGKLHDHIIVCNQDEETGNAIKGRTHAGIVFAVNDQLCRDEGLTIIGQERQKADERTTWAEQRKGEPEGSFKRALGDAVDKARRESGSLDEFKANLGKAGVEVRESVRKDKQTGETHAGWTYYMMDETGPKRRRRRMKASNLADDLTKEGVEARFEREREAQPWRRESLEERYARIKAEVDKAVAEKQAAQKAQEAPERRSETSGDSLPAEGEKTPQKPAEEVTGRVEAPVDEPNEGPTLFETFTVDEGDVRDDLDALRRQTRKTDPMHERTETREVGRADAHDVTARLQAEVDRRRAEFRKSKAALDSMGRAGGSLAMMNRMFLQMARSMGQPADRQVAAMMAQMMALLMRMEAERRERERREELERELYERRADMWDAEKRLRAAERAMDGEWQHSRSDSTRQVSGKLEGVYEAAQCAMRDEGEQYQ